MNPDTGEISIVEEQESPVVQPDFYFGIEKLPNPKCKKCFGRGYIGRDILTDHVIPCKCVGTVVCVDNRERE